MIIIDFNTIDDLIDYVGDSKKIFKNIIAEAKIVKDIISKLIELGFDFDIIDFNYDDEYFLISIYEENFDVVPFYELDFEFSDDEEVLVQDEIDYVNKDSNFTVFTIGTSNEIDDDNYIHMTDTKVDEYGNSSTYSKSFYSTDKDLVRLMAELWGA